MDSVLNINGRIVGDGSPAYIIAEMSANHAGSKERALELIRRAKEAGADCVKIQTYTADSLTIDCDNEYFNVSNGTWDGENLYRLYQKAYTPWEWQEQLRDEAAKVGIDFLSTPFDKTSVDFLEGLGVGFYKIASFEMVDIPLIQYIASKNKPIIMSTGMGTLEEIREAVQAVRETGNHQLALLKCSSAYPALTDEMHLRNIQDLKNRFRIPVGLSDHSLGSLGAVAAVSLGANIIEKHFCISREIDNPDASFSMTVEEFAHMVEEIRSVERAVGSVAYGITRQEESSRVFRRSVFVVEDIAKGETFNEKNTRIIRPGYGCKPKYYPDIIGLAAGRDIERGTPFRFDMTEKGCVLFLTNNDVTMDVYHELQKREKDIRIFRNKLTPEIIDELEPSFVVSYNYRHLIPGEVLDRLRGKIINCHMSYLPYNRGASPNFFSFYDNTKKGVTIHVMDYALDTGDILLQEEVFLDENRETFASAYDTLIRTMDQLLLDNWDGLRNHGIRPVPQPEDYTKHTQKEFQELREKYPFEWNDRIVEWKKKYHLQMEG